MFRNPNFPSVTNVLYPLQKGQDLKYLFTLQLLDLKVGTRQYGDGASAGKKQSKSAKVAETTSGSLGLRLGGMQVYQVQYLIPLLTGSLADPDP
jgi:hypothetical protein